MNLRVAECVLNTSFSHIDLRAAYSCKVRDMYYRDPELFKMQLVVDRYVDNIAYTLGIERHALNVVGRLALDSLLSFSCCSQVCSSQRIGRRSVWNNKEG